MQTTRSITHIRTETAPHTIRTESRSARSTARSTSLYRHLAGRILRRLRFQLAFYVFAFYLLPVMLPSSGMLLLTLVYPALCFVLSTLYGMRYGFISHYLAVPIIVFLPASLLAFKAYSFLYALCYLLISCIALTFGALYRQMSK